MDYSTPDRYHAARETASPVPAEEARPPGPVGCPAEQVHNTPRKTRPWWLRIIIQLVRLILALAFVSIAVKVTGIAI